MKTASTPKAMFLWLMILTLTAFTAPLSAETAPTAEELQAAYDTELENLEVTDASEITPEQARAIVDALIAQFGAENVVTITTFLIQANTGNPALAASFRTAAVAAAPARKAAINQISGPGSSALMPETIPPADRPVVSPADADDDR